VSTKIQGALFPNINLGQEVEVFSAPCRGGVALGAHPSAQGALAVPHLLFRLRAGATVRTLGRLRSRPTQWLGSARCCVPYRFCNAPPRPARPIAPRPLLPPN